MIGATSKLALLIRPNAIETRICVYLNHRNFRRLNRILHPFDVLARNPKVLECTVQSAGAQLRSCIALPWRLICVTRRSGCLYCGRSRY